VFDTLSPLHMPHEARIVWSLFHSKTVAPEVAADPQQELFVPVPAEGEGFEVFRDAVKAAYELMESESWEVGVMVLPTGGPRPWRIHWLEPASPFDRRSVAAGEATGYEWKQVRPPRREQEHALHELRRLWDEDGGRRAYAIERQVMSLADLAHVTMEFRNRNIY
jgi:hypothetical protein